MMLTRRHFLAAAAYRASAAPAKSRLALASLGANTAISGLGLLDAIRLLRDIGFRVIEIHPMGVPEPSPGKYPGFEFDRLGAAEKSRIRKELSAFDRVTTHLPYTGLDYFARDPDVAAAAVKRVDVALDGSAWFGAKLAVIHPKPGAGFSAEEQWPVMLTRFRRGGDQAQRHRIQLALETGYPRSLDKFAALVREIAHPAVGATLDVGYQSQYAELARIAPADRGKPEGIRAYNDLNIALVERLESRLFHLHVHDIDPPTWKEHLPLGTNFVDYPRLLGALHRIGYAGSLVLEIGAPPAEMENHLRAAKQKFAKYLGAAAASQNARKAIKSRG